jgi:hypothetical protein
VVDQVHKKVALLGCTECVKGEHVLVALAKAMEEYPDFRTGTEAAVSKFSSSMCDKFHMGKINFCQKDFLKNN